MTKQAENRVRKAHNLPLVGQKWISETLLFNELKELFPEETIIQHGKAPWLGRQHLDIFFPEKNLAIEYQGRQHLEPVSYFGGEESFKKLQKRDNRKKRLCLENKCELIYVYEKYNIKDVELEIKKYISPNK